MSRFSSSSRPTGLRGPRSASLAPLAVSLALLAACSGGAAGGGDPRGLVPIGAERTPEEAAELADAHAGHGHGTVQPDGRAYYHDFGTVPDGEVARHVFQLENTDPVPVTIVRMTPSCGCTVPSVRYVDDSGEEVRGRPGGEPEILVVPPGEIVDLAVEIDTTRVKTKNAMKLLQVRITTDSAHDPYVTLECSILAEQPFRTQDDRAHLGKVAHSVGGRTTARVVQLGDSGARITGVGEVPDDVRATVEEEPAAGNTVWRVDVELLPPVPVGVLRREIELLAETADGEPAPPYVLTVSATGVPDVALQPSRVILRGFRGDGGATSSTTLVANVPGQRLRVLSADVTGRYADWIEVAFEPVDPDAEGRSERWRIDVSTRPGIDAERFSGNVLLELDDPQTPVIDLTYAGL